MIIWYDITNSPQVHFLLAIKNSLGGKYHHDYIITTREFAETTYLLRQKKENNFTIIGTHYGRVKKDKIKGLISRFFAIYKNVSAYDISISCGSEEAIWNSFLRRKKSIAFGDNDLAKQWTYGIFVNYVFFPSAIDKNIITRQGINSGKLYQYHGYKEDIYLADYNPDYSFINNIPFKNYVLVRPENIEANYIDNIHKKTITPFLLKGLSKSGYNILYLPRYKIDKEYAKGIDRVFIPKDPVNGLDACYFADAVLTGAGTFAREAACLGVPSFSFFAGKQLLSVDKALIKEKKMFWSRNINELLEALKKSERKYVDLTHSKYVQEEVISKIWEVIQD